MNNTKKRTTLTAMFAVLMAATLVVGTFATVATTQSAFAIAKKPPGHADKKTRDNGSSSNSKNGNTVTALKCQNKGSASGFDTTVDQECENLICTHPGENATCVQEGAVAAAVPVKLTCEQCLTKFLNAGQISGLLIATDTNTLGQLCGALPTFNVGGLEEFLISQLGVSESAAAQLIQCLLDSGVVLAGGG